MSTRSTRKTLNVVDKVVATENLPRAEAKNLARKTKLAIRATAGKMNTANGKLFAEDEMGRIKNPEQKRIAFFAYVSAHRDQIEPEIKEWSWPVQSRYEKLASKIGLDVEPLPEGL